MEREIALEVRHHVASVWEDLARASVPFLPDHGGGWGIARRWWGPGLDRRPLEIDLVAENADRGRLLVGEVKWSSPRNGGCGGARLRRDGGALFRELEQKIDRIPFAEGREVIPMLWLATSPEDLKGDQVVTPRRVLDALR